MWIKTNRCLVRMKDPNSRVGSHVDFCLDTLHGFLNTLHGYSLSVCFHRLLGPLPESVISFVESVDGLKDKEALFNVAYNETDKISFRAVL